MLYTAGIVPHEQLLYDAGLRHRLLSFADVRTSQKTFDFWIHDGPQPGASVFLDCGAFSVHTRKAVIDLDHYCEYIEEHADNLQAYAGLDVIGNWHATAVNLDVMRKRGLSPVPCFHRGSPFTELDRLAREFPYIALGGLGTNNESNLQPYLDACWARLREHWPIKVHAFGLIAQWTLDRYPFYSADSATAILSAARFGRAMNWQDGRMVSCHWSQHRDVAMTNLSRRLLRNVVAMTKLERHVTNVWRTRGIDAGEDQCQ
jgi:hypothetical protein